MLGDLQKRFSRGCRFDAVAFDQIYERTPGLPASLRIRMKERRMSGVRVLVGTRKGAFILTSDARRQQWEVSEPDFAGWEIYHMKGSPVDPNRLYASQSS